MNRLRNQFICGAAVVVAVVLAQMAGEVTSEAAENSSGYDFPNSGVSEILSPSSTTNEETETPQEEQLKIYEKLNAESERMLSELVMAKVNDKLNVRAEANEEADKVGFMYSDCGGTIIERQEEWTLVKSGALQGWCSNKFLAFGNEALDMAEEVGQMMVTLSKDTEALKLRAEASDDAEVITIMSKSDIAVYQEVIDDEWISVDLYGDFGYLKADYVDVNFHIDTGETVEQVKTREKIEEQLRKEAEEKAKQERARQIAEEIKKNRTENRGAVLANADEVRLLAALIYCEAGNQPYEGKVAVGAVVMNRVKSPAYPNSIYSVIYASGQFTPALSGKVDRVYLSGPPESCYQAAAAALNGETTVGGATHFRRNNGHAGYVLGDHVFW